MPAFTASGRSGQASMSSPRWGSFAVLLLYVLL